MTFPDAGVRACDGLSARYPDLAHSKDENDRRTLMRYIGEQMSFALGPKWGNKTRHGLGPAGRSKDSSGYLEDDGTVSAWDCFNGTTRERSVHAGDPPNYPHLPKDEADFVPCMPHDHLNWGASVPPAAPPPGTPTPPPPADDDIEALAEILSGFMAEVRGRDQNRYDQLERIFANLTAQHEAIQAHIAAPAVAPAPALSPELLALLARLAKLFPART